ncbi:MAG: ectoine hydrolase [Paracoccaceae bacterium]
MGFETGSLMAIIDRLDFLKSEFESCISKVGRAMQAADIDTLICSDPSNMAWLTGYYGWSFYVHQAGFVGVNRCAAVVW